MVCGWVERFQDRRENEVSVRVHSVLISPLFWTSFWLAIFACLTKHSHTPHPDRKHLFFVILLVVGHLENDHLFSVIMSLQFIVSPIFQDPSMYDNQILMFKFNIWRKLLKNKIISEGHY